MNKTGYVYVVCFENLIKVGYSGRKPNSRVKTHKGLVKAYLNIEAKQEYVSAFLENARDVEKQLISLSRELYGPSALGKEWFSAGDNGVALIAELESGNVKMVVSAEPASKRLVTDAVWLYEMFKETEDLRLQLETIKLQNPIGEMLCYMAEEQLSLNSELSALDEELQVQFANSVNWALNLASKGLDDDALSLYAILDLLKKVAVGGEIDFENSSNMYVAAIVNIVSKLREKEVPEDELFGMLEIFGILAELADRAR